MKKIYLSLLIILFGLDDFYSQNYSLNVANNHTTNITCAAHVYNTYCSTIGTTGYYCEGIDRWQAFTNGTGAPIKLNITFLDLETGDYLRVYRGVGTAGTLLASYTFTTTTLGNVILEPSGTITIRFTTDNDGWIAQGFDAIIGCTPTGCNGNSPAGDNCSTAPQICNLNGYCGNTSGWYTEDNPTLGGATSPGFAGSIENNSWINFVAGATTATLSVESANCLSSTRGIQGAVYASTDCSTFAPVTGGDFNQTTGPGLVTLNLSGLVAGNGYYLMLDGYGGNICDYTVTAAGNVQTLNTTSSATSNTICPNETFTVTATAGGTSYLWNPAPLSTFSNTAVYNNVSSTSVITTTAIGYCGASATVALTMSVVNIPINVTNTTVCNGASVTLTAGGATTYSWSTGDLTSTISVSPSSLTVYTVTGTSGSCVNSNTVSVNVSSSPTVAVTNATICNGAVTTLTASNASTYSWNTGASTATISVSPNALTVYTVTGTTAGCSDTKTVSVSVTQNPTVAVTNTAICVGGTVTLTAGSATSYSWSTGDLTSTISVSPSSLIVYTVTGTTNNCSDTKTVSVTVNPIPTSTASASSDITCSTPTITLNSTLAGASYTWSAPSGGVLSAGNSQSTSASNAGGIYTLNIQSAAGCTFSTTLSVTQNTVIPSGLSAGGNQTLACNSTSVTLNGSVTTPTNATVNWTGNNICGVATNFTTQACSAGIYTLTATDPSNGCVDHSTVEVFANAGAPSLTITSNALVVDCNNATQSVTVTSTPNTNVTYNWNNTPFSASSDSSVASFNNSGTYVCTVTNTISHCASQIQVVVTKNTTKPTTAASTTGTLTCVTSTVSCNANLSGMTYTWTAPAGGSVTSANTETTIASGVSGNYTLTIKDLTNGCTYSTTAVVPQNITQPTGVSAGVNQTLTCSSTSVTLNGSVLTPTNATVNWTGNNICGIATNFTTQACAVGIYTLTATDLANGCTNTSTVQVFSNTVVPTLTLTSNALVLDCNNAVKTVTVNSTPSSNNLYSWNIPPSTLLVGGSIASFSNSNTYICTVTNTLSNCTNSAQVIVTTNTLAPTILISGTQSLTCLNPTAVISTTTSSSVSYTWTGSLVSGQGTGAVTVNTAGDYSVTIKDAVNGCTNIVGSHIDLDKNPPIVSISTTSSNSIITCQNPSVSLTVNSIPSGSYTWSSGGHLATENVTAVNVYNVLVVSSVNGCTNSAQYSVSGNTVPPIVTTTNTTILCGSPSVAIGAISSATNSSYSWTTSGSGSIISGANTFTAIAGTAGQYIVTVKNIDNGCLNTGTVMVASIPITASITANPTSGTAPLLVNFTSQSTGTVFSWSFDDNNNNSSSNANPSHIYNNAGTYIVTLVASDASGLCIATQTLSVEVFENSSIIIPNVFTPNGDGKNDIFKITTTGMKDLNCEIFNRWGTKVYSITSVSGSWDGGNHTDGTYFFMLQATGLDGKEFKQQGYINLFK